MRNNLFITFQENRKLTYDILECLEDKNLYQKWERPGLDNFAKHFSEMASVVNAYTEAILTGNMDFSSVPDVFEFQGNESKIQLKKLLQESDSRLEAALASAELKDEVFWYDMTLPLEIHLVNIISHEVLHQGMMIMALYKMGLTLPDSLVDNWSLPQVNG